ncbi:MAG TPA: sigma-70 family RNA polymerase sigma factor [Bryobacteraceae bacterium]|nr:sigma-70 family RNA polymerase sigma factor [Bryobacteraceae bacterium]
MVATGNVMDFNCQVLAAAWKIKRSLAEQVELADLYQAGWLGLLNAWEKFDPARSVPFATYASFRIRGAILDSLRQQDYLSRNTRRRWRCIQAAAQRLTQATGGAPTDQQVAEACGESEKNVSQLRHVQQPSSDVVSLADQRVEAPERALYRAELMQLARSAHLGRQQARVLNLRYWNDLTLKKIGLLLGVSEGRVSQIHTAAIRQLRKTLKVSQARECDGGRCGDPDWRCCADGAAECAASGKGSARPSAGRGDGGPSGQVEGPCSSLCGCPLQSSALDR